jgi:hypothetical protein
MFFSFHISVARHGKTWQDQVSAEQMLGELGLELEVHDARQAGS